MKSFFARKWLSGLLAFTVALNGVSFISAHAEENQGFRSPNTYTSGDYTFDKLSHPDNPTSSPDGIVDYVGNGAVTEKDMGQGDRGQSYSWAAAAYEDYVYVGTCYAAMGNTLQLMDSVLGNSFDKEVMKATLQAIFNGTFFYGQEDGVDSGGILVKVNVNTGETTLLMSRATTGQAPLFRNAVRFNDKLYFCGSVSESGRPALPSIYEVDPKTDSIRCVYTGLTLQNIGLAYKEGICTGIRGMVVYNDQLVVSCVGIEGPYIMISTNSSDEDLAFKTIATNEDLFGYPAYHYSDSIYGGSIWEIVNYNGSLYVALCTGTPDNKPDEHTMQSFAIVRGDENEDGSWQWTSVVGDQEKDNAKYTFGIDPERTRAGACNLVVYDGYLYIGEYEDIEIALEDVLFNYNVQFLAKNLEQSVSLYRMDENEDIELVVGDATSMFPEGGISGVGSGFGHHENQYIWQSTVYDGKLYLGTFDSSSLLEPIGQFTNGDLINMTPEEWESQINYIKVLVELLIKKAINPNSEIALMDDFDEETKAYDLVQEAIEAANERYSQVTAYSLEDDTEETVTLTDEQTEALVTGILNGDIMPDSLDDDTAQMMIALNAELSSWAAMLDEQGNQEFIELYENIFKEYGDLSDKIPEALKTAIDHILSAFAKDNLIAFGKILKYLSTAERGFDMYVSEDGINFDAITTNGFNDPYNHGLRIFATGQDWMVIGTANPFYGTQLWELREEKKTEEPDEPTDPEDPVDPDNPVDPDHPVDPDNPVDPENPNNPNTPSHPEETENPTNTQTQPATVATGDTSNPALWMTLLSVSALGLVLTGEAVKKKKKYGEN